MSVLFEAVLIVKVSSSIKEKSLYFVLAAVINTLNKLVKTYC